jgi:hypothetical protein
MVTLANAKDAPTTGLTRYYICLIGPTDHDRRADTPFVWSARVVLTSASGFPPSTVCRYTPDKDTVRNDEHPDTYRLVSGALHNQNFVVVTPGVPCPAGTVLHQTF